MTMVTEENAHKNNKKDGPHRKEAWGRLFIQFASFQISHPNSKQLLPTHRSAQFTIGIKEY